MFFAHPQALLLSESMVNDADENDSSTVQDIFDSDDTDEDPNYLSETESESSSQSESVSANSLAIGSLGSQQGAGNASRN
ncbi:unnamed protein product [Acanthoscelides obtectus]|uniref:Uncharacterized protein n=1 Tax=Acanthoscelides obtectus TaxID=200917 RepID=A0A9P0KH24_ACAOB|nr:unnamed protein product [Acanthoscelides obtectus]CAK1642546.1 hypothetical protein AOBTE_LOCUS13110 [Acanthoscelides obtectus]